MNIENLKIPNHVAIILDGNGRWAKAKGLPRSKGHEAGFENLKTISEYIFEKGTKVLSVYAFSTENFKRSKNEVDFLMNIFESKFKEYSTELKEKNIKLVFSGKKESPLPKGVIKTMNDAEELTKNNTGGILNICINYGGRSEIIEATKKIANKIKNNELDIENITEENFGKYLFQNLPDVDLMIRTSGEQRISNFLLWQNSYAEFYFPNVCFPDFNQEEYDKALLEYTKRDRRFGSVNNE